MLDIQEARAHAKQYRGELTRLMSTAPMVIEAMADEIERLRASLKELRLTACLLQQNAEGCAANHYGHDMELHGRPGWLVDTKAAIDRAQALIIDEQRVREDK